MTMNTQRFIWVFLFVGMTQAFLVTTPTPKCVGDIISIDERILITVVGKPQMLGPIEIVLFERQIRDVYNTLAYQSCFGGAFYSITDVEIQQDFLDTMDLGTGGDAETVEFVMRVRMKGICRGCDKDTLLTRVVLTPVRRQLHRRLQVPISACPNCAPPILSEFISSLNLALQTVFQSTAIKNVESVKAVAELDQIVCSSDIIEMQSDVIMGFSGNIETLTGTKLSALEQAFLETYNELNLVTSDTCDSTFHKVMSVAAIVDDSLTLDFPTSILFRVSLTCRGCDPAFPILSIVDRRRTVEKAVDSAQYDDDPIPVRYLQDVNSDLCFCARGAQSRTPSRIEFQTAFQSRIASMGNADLIAVVGRTVEVDEVDCPPDIEIFETIVAAEFFGDENALTEADNRRLEALFVQSYNEAQANFCDPFFRRIINATTISSGQNRYLLEEQTKRGLQFNFDFSVLISFFRLFRIIAKCRSCSQRTKNLFQNDAARKLQPSLIDFSIASAPIATTGLSDSSSTCYCDVNFLDSRSPTQGEFKFLYDRNVKREVRVIGNVTFIDGFVTQSPSASPTMNPSDSPTDAPSISPSFPPSSTPSHEPSSKPSSGPSPEPSSNPSSEPSTRPSSEPSMKPSFEPSMKPSISPTSIPSFAPSTHPSSQPTSVPSLIPTVVPSIVPSHVPSEVPSFAIPSPTPRPTALPETLKRPQTPYVTGSRRPGGRRRLENSID